MIPDDIEDDMASIMLVHGFICAMAASIASFWLSAAYLISSARFLSSIACFWVSDRAPTCNSLSSSAFSAWYSASVALRVAAAFWSSDRMNMRAPSA